MKTKILLTIGLLIPSFGFAQEGMLGQSGNLSNIADSSGFGVTVSKAGANNVYIGGTLEIEQGLTGNVVVNLSAGDSLRIVNPSVVKNPFMVDNAVNDVVIDSAGNVGIGTATPGAKLEANGRIIADNYQIGSSANQLISYSTGIKIISSTGGTNITLDPTNNILLLGSVGIETTSPRAKLDVDGNAFADTLFFVSNDAETTLDSTFSIHSSGGVTVGQPTGGDKGAGTINAVGVYDDNVLLSDFILDLYYDGKIRKEDIKYQFDKVLMDIEQTEKFTKENRHLPSMPGRDEWKDKGNKSLGELVTKLWETIERQQLHIYELNNRLKIVESK